MSALRLWRFALPVLVLLMALMGVWAAPTRAGVPTLTNQDLAQQQAFLTALQEASRAAERNDRFGTRVALRRAVQFGGYTFSSSRTQAACGFSAFQMPSWVM